MFKPTAGLQRIPAGFGNACQNRNELACAAHVVNSPRPSVENKEFVTQHFQVYFIFPSIPTARDEQLEFEK